MINLSPMPLGRLDGPEHSASTAEGREGLAVRVVAALPETPAEQVTQYAHM